MPRTQDDYWIGFQATAAEKKLLESYCKQMMQTKTEVLRSLLKSLSYPDGERSHWLLKLELGASYSKIIDEYCKLSGLTPSDAVKYAIELLGQIETMHLSETDAKIFLAAINSPPEPNEKLKELLQAKAPWQTQTPGKITKDEIRPWLQSIGDEAEKEIELADQLRANAEHLQSIANQMIETANYLDES